MNLSDYAMPAGAEGGMAYNRLDRLIATVDAECQARAPMLARGIPAHPECVARQIVTARCGSAFMRHAYA